MAKNKEEKKKIRICFLVTPDEYQLIKEKAFKSTTPLLSDYIRKIIFRGKITVVTRNQSMDDFMEEMIRFRNEFILISRNHELLIKKLQDFEHCADLKNLVLLITEEQKIMSSKIEEIKFHIGQFASSW